MAGNIKGITIEIDGSTTKLQKALGDVNKTSRDLSKELTAVNRELKFNPGNSELIAQKQRILGESVENTKKKLEQLKEAHKQASVQLERGEIGQDEFDALSREIIKAESQLKYYNAEMKKLDPSKVDKIAAGFEKAGEKAVAAGKKLTTGLTAPIVGMGAVSFKLAADVEDALGATDQIFKNSSEQVKSWASDLKTYYGITKGEALEYSNVMGAMLQNIGGLSEEESAKTSAALVELAGDLSAMFGGTTESAVNALTGALKGNNTMLDNYGMGVNDATIKTKAFEMGLYDGKGQMDLNTKQAATLALIMEQTADAQGQAAREADGASGSMKAVSTEIKNLSAEIGEVLLPIVTPLIQNIRDLANWFRKLSPETKDNIVKFALLAAAIGPLLVVIGTVFGAIAKIIGVFQLFGGVLAGIAAGPIGWIILAIVGIIAIIAALKLNIGGITDWIRDKFQAIGEFFGGLKDKASTAFGNIISGAEELASRLPEAVGDAIQKALDWIEGKWEDFKNAGKNIITSIGDGISEGVGWIKEKIGGVASTIRGYLPFSPAKEGPLKDLNKLNFGGTIADSILRGRAEIERAMNAALSMDRIKTDFEWTMRPDQLTPAQATQTSTGAVMNNSIVINNPVPERASESVRKTLLKQSYNMA